MMSCTFPLLSSSHLTKISPIRAMPYYHRLATKLLYLKTNLFDLKSPILQKYGVGPRETSFSLNEGLRYSLSPPTPICQSISEVWVQM